MPLSKNPVSHFGLTRQLSESQSVETGIPFLLPALAMIAPTVRGTIVVFSPTCETASVYMVEPGVPAASFVRTMADTAPVAAWVKDHSEPYLLPTSNPVFVPKVFDNLTSPGQPHHLVVPIIINDQPVMLALFAIQESASWRRPQLDAVRDLRSLWTLWLERILLRQQLGAADDGLSKHVDYLRESIRTERGLRALTGQSDAMKVVRQAIQQVAATDSTVLILGETGTGKELVARAIHQASARHRRLLVTVNCASLAPALVASELFGHEAGAFTGATKRRLGRFETAHQGTLFLDEIGEIPLEMQPALLRALQEKSIERVGSNSPLPVDVRLIAATHANLESAITAGKFRVDLFFRLNVFPIRVPALRDRIEDIPDLANHFATHFAHRMNKPIKRIADESLEILTTHAWPGNVRELENCIERAVIVAESDVLTIDPAWFSATSSQSETWHNRERQSILETLEKTAGRIYGPNGAAARLGLKPTTLYGKMRRLGIHNLRGGEPA